MVQAEEAIYIDSADPLVNWDTADLVRLFGTVGCVVQASMEDERSDVQIKLSIGVGGLFF